VNVINFRKYLNSESDDLLEAYFHQIDRPSWESLFKWMKGRITSLDCQHGRISISELNLDKFLSGELSYIAHIECTNGFDLVLSIIENDQLTIDIEVSRVTAEEDSDMFIASIIEIARVLDSTDYLICPEFQKDNALYVNGEFV